MNLLYLVVTFSRIGLFAIGGGLATLPFLFEIADNSEWLTRVAVGNMLAVAQSFPGAIGANLAAYMGFTYAGPPGGYAAALGLMVPSVIIIIIAARMLEAFKENKVVKSLFTGLRPAAAGLLSAAGFGAIVLCVWDSAALAWYQYIRWKEALLLVLLFVLIMKFKKHPIFYIAGAGILGVILKL